MSRSGAAAALEHLVVLHEMLGILCGPRGNSELLFLLSECSSMQECMELVSLEPLRDSVPALA